MYIYIYIASFTEPNMIWQDSFADLITLGHLDPRSGGFKKRLRFDGVPQVMDG